MKSRHVEKMEVVNKNAICSFCQNKGSCKMADDSIAFCTTFKKSKMSIEHLVDFYECKQGHKFGVDGIDYEVHKSSIPCPVCRNPAFFRETVKFGVW